uniref:Uncharacterized protein n=1 Tax=Glossina austeni TaxID=7395 RepID=A0A1A9UZW6_GLOAU
MTGHIRSSKNLRIETNSEDEIPSTVPYFIRSGFSGYHSIQAQKTKNSKRPEWRFWERRGAVASVVGPRLPPQIVRFYNTMTPAVLKAALNKRQFFAIANYWLLIPAIVIVLRLMVVRYLYVCTSRSVKRWNEYKVTADPDVRPSKIVQTESHPPDSIVRFGGNSRSPEVEKFSRKLAMIEDNFSKCKYLEQPELLPHNVLGSPASAIVSVDLTTENPSTDCAGKASVEDSIGTPVYSVPNLKLNNNLNLNNKLNNIPVVVFYTPRLAAR